MTRQKMKDLRSGVKTKNKVSYTDTSEGNISVLKKDIIKRLEKTRYTAFIITPDLTVYKSHVSKLDEALRGTKIFLSGFGLDYEKQELNHVYMHMYDVGPTDKYGDMIFNVDYFMIPETGGSVIIHIIDLEKIPECAMIASLLPKEYRKVFLKITNYNSTSYGHSYASVTYEQAEFYRKLIANNVIEVKKKDEE